MNADDKFKIKLIKKSEDNNFAIAKNEWIYYKSVQLKDDCLKCFHCCKNIKSVKILRNIKTNETINMGETCCKNFLESTKNNSTRANYHTLTSKTPLPYIHHISDKTFNDSTFWTGILIVAIILYNNM